MLGELLLELGHDRGAASELDAAAVRQLGPRRIAKSVLLRVGRLGPDAGALAQALAVLGEADEPSRASALAGLEPAAAAALADALTELGVLSPGRPVRFARTLSCAPRSTRTPPRTSGPQCGGAPPSCWPAIPSRPPSTCSQPTRTATRRPWSRCALPPEPRRRAAPRTAPSGVCARRSPSRPRQLSNRAAGRGRPCAAPARRSRCDRTAPGAFELTETQPARATIGLALGHQLLDSRHPQGERASSGARACARGPRGSHAPEHGRGADPGVGAEPARCQAVDGAASARGLGAGRAAPRRAHKYGRCSSRSRSTPR